MPAQLQPQGPQQEVVARAILSVCTSEPFNTSSWVQWRVRPAHGAISLQGLRAKPQDLLMGQHDEPSRPHIARSGLAHHDVLVALLVHLATSQLQLPGLPLPEALEAFFAFWHRSLFSFPVCQPRCHRPLAQRRTSRHPDASNLVEPNPSSTGQPVESLPQLHHKSGPLGPNIAQSGGGLASGSRLLAEAGAHHQLRREAGFALVVRFPQHHRLARLRMSSTSLRSERCCHAPDAVVARFGGCQPSSVSGRGSYSLASFSTVSFSLPMIDSSTQAMCFGRGPIPDILANLCPTHRRCPPKNHTGSCSHPHTHFAISTAQLELGAPLVASRGGA